MIEKRNIVIGVQVRHGSTRLPGKALKKIGGKTIIEHIMSSCANAVRYLRNDCRLLNAEIFLTMLTPKDDPVAKLYKNHFAIIEGSDNDVLSRYVEAQAKYNASYVVRITGDCLDIPTHLIAKHIKSALIKEQDYTTNVLIRSFREGFDCEVISKRLLKWLDQNAQGPEREHVTTLIGPGQPFPFRDKHGKDSICHILNHYNESEIKTSIDTDEDYERALRIFEERESRIRAAVSSGVFII